ncbi:MAG: hypothetical protein P4L55_05920, partial [Syntrophobacteraceae bacterium]|nr:hypothetical protein [Syntrophobacteraceae bacterium]
TIDSRNFEKSSFEIIIAYRPENLERGAKFAGKTSNCGSWDRSANVGSDSTANRAYPKRPILELFWRMG